MSFQNPFGEKIDFRDIEAKAAAHGISLRAGCFCNPGVDEYYNDLPTEILTSYFDNNSNGDYGHLLETTGLKRGAIRISVGIASRVRDIDLFIAFAESWKDVLI